MLETATTLDDAYEALSPEPLVTEEELEAFYGAEVNEVRGGDRVDRLVFRLDRAAGTFSKALVIGHSGVGKSTELSRLAQQVEPRYSVIRFSVTAELDSVSFEPVDVLLYMMAEVAERTARPVEMGGAGKRPPAALLKDLLAWFDVEETTVTKERAVEGGVAAGLGVERSELWARVLGLFGDLKGEIKYAANRRVEVVQYRIKRISELIALANRVLDECNRLLEQETGKQWLFIGEDFDKPGVAPDLVERLFLQQGHEIIRSLHAHMIFTIPIALGYSQQATRLPVADRTQILDTPVFDARHEPHPRGRKALRSILSARVAASLFATRVVDKLIVASGGNLRDLLFLARGAVEEALVEGAGKVGTGHANAVIDGLRLEYTRRLGDSPYDKERIPYADKAARLVRIYDGDADARIPDAILYSLLYSRAVQEFNGQGWLGVHPLVVDILKSQERLPADAPGGTA